jgi:hypothetical protein
MTPCRTLPFVWRTTTLVRFPAGAGTGLDPREEEIRRAFEAAREWARGEPHAAELLEAIADLESALQEEDQ